MTAASCRRALAVAVAMTVMVTVMGVLACVMCASGGSLVTTV